VRQPGRRFGDRPGARAGDAVLRGPLEKPNMTTATNAVLTDETFVEISSLVQELCGIRLHDGKKELVRARLGKRLRELGLGDYRDYLEYLRRDAGGPEITALLDAISTNQTSFFRECEHFEHLAAVVLPGVVQRNGGARRLRIWSAGCSSGEEPYSIAITVWETLPDAGFWDVRILATDLSTRALRRAAEGVYEADRIEPVSPMVRNRSFTCVQSRPERRYQVRRHLREMVRLARLNLMEAWPMKGPFDVIFCRNVMIYFDRPTRERLIGRFWELLTPGGTLFVGHSESLTGINHRFRYVQPTVYAK
jgi:chemotaxis protein methyltransferase CheR